MKTKKSVDNLSINLPRKYIKLLDKIIKKNPDFVDRESLIKYCVRKLYDDLE